MRFSSVNHAIWFAAACALLLAGCSRETPAPPVPEAGYVVAKLVSAPITVELPGRTAAYEASEVRPQVSGVIRARLFTEGSIVRAGQTLYEIDPSLYRAALNQAAANLDNARAQRDAAKARADRFRPLAEMEAVSKQDYTDAAAAARQANAAVAQNSAQLETARINLRFTRVPAPISGRIGRSLVTTGALVTNGQADPLTTIQRLDPIYVDIQQSSAELLALRRQIRSAQADRGSAAVRLKLEDGSDYGAEGQLEFAESLVDPQTGSVTLRARFPNPEGLLLPGMYVRARLTQAVERDVVLVSQTALSRDVNGDATVIVVGPGDKAVIRKVRADRTIGDKWVVTAGLKPGEKIIVEGLGRVKPGAPIRPVLAGSPPTAPNKPGPAKPS